jgi:hypothetical protein
LKTILYACVRTVTFAPGSPSRGKEQLHGPWAIAATGQLKPRKAITADSQSLFMLTTDLA